MISHEFNNLLSSCRYSDYIGSCDFLKIVLLVEMGKAASGCVKDSKVGFISHLFSILNVTAN